MDLWISIVILRLSRRLSRESMNVEFYEFTDREDGTNRLRVFMDTARYDV